MLRPLFIFLALVALSSVASAGKGPGCSQYTTCVTCVPHTNCGWCESTGQCLFGNAVGPGGDPKNCTEWLYSSCVLVECTRLTQCQPCVNDPFCGFCLSTNKCVTGDLVGPIDGTVCSNYLPPGSHGCPSQSRTRTRTPVPSRSRTPIPTRTRTPTPTRTRFVPSRTPTPTRTRFVQFTRTRTPTRTRFVQFTRTRTPTPTRTRTRTRFIPRSSNPRRSDSNTPSNSIFASSPAYTLVPTLFVGITIAVASFVFANFS